MGNNERLFQECFFCRSKFGVRKTEIDSCEECGMFLRIIGRNFLGDILKTLICMYRIKYALMDEAHAQLYGDEVPFADKLAYSKKVAEILLKCSNLISAYRYRMLLEGILEHRIGVAEKFDVIMSQKPKKKMIYKPPKVPVKSAEKVGK